MAKKRVVFCLTGLLARSFTRTWPSISRFVSDLRDSGRFEVDIAVFANDPENALVDGVRVSHAQASALLRKDEGERVVIVREWTQEKLDAIAAAVPALSLQWLLCHGDPRAPCVASCKKNMQRHMILEGHCGVFLRHSSYDLAISMSPDIEIACEDEIVDKLYRIVGTNNLLTPLRASGPYITNGFCAGHPDIVGRFLTRDWVFDPGAVRECVETFAKLRIAVPNAYINWEAMCWYTLRRNKVGMQSVKVQLVKVRANGDGKRAWDGR